MNKMYKTQKKYWLFLLLIDFIGYILFFWKKFKKIPKNPQKILVIRLEHIGDMVLTSNFIYHLKKCYPKSEVTILCKNQTKLIAKMIKGVDEVLTLNVPWSARDKVINYKTLLKFCIRNFKKYDLGFDLFFDSRNIVLGNFLSKYLCGSGIRGFGFLLNHKIKWENKTKHIVSRQLDLLKSLNFKLIEKNISLNINSKKLILFKKKLNHYNLNNKKYSLIQMSAGSSARELPLTFWSKLINSNKNKLFVCADIDLEKVKILKSKVKSNVKFLQLNLEEYIYLIYLSTEVISVESSAIHIGSAFKKKVIDYHSGQTLAKEWGPYLNKNAKIYQDKSCKFYPCGFNICPFRYPSRCMEFKYGY